MAQVYRRTAAGAQASRTGGDDAYRQVYPKEEQMERKIAIAVIAVIASAAAAMLMPFPAARGLFALAMACAGISLIGTALVKFVWDVLPRL
jgi:hypothetical protein